MILVGHESACSRTTNGAKLCVANPSVLLAALPEFTVAAARRIIIGRAGTVALLLLVVATKE